MTLEQAIKTALEYESKVKKTYSDAVGAAGNESGKSFYNMMADEEQTHIDYLRERLDEWKSTGEISVTELKTAIPPRERLKEAAKNLRKELKPDNTDSELRLLGKAQEVESETSGFYKQMVDTLDDRGKELFKRFVEIEEGHLAIVEAQIDNIGNTGYWFDVNEFTME
jgi:rubrerythrin